MSITVRFFASLREITGEGTMVILQAGNIEELLAELRRQLSAEAMTALTAEHVRLAHNQELITGMEPVRLRDGDEVAFMPPVTGG